MKKQNVINKPAAYDNNWLGNTATTATAYDVNNKIICTTLDAPNPVAYLVQQNKTVFRVVGLLGEYSMEDMRIKSLDKKLYPTYANHIKQAK